LAAFVLPLTLAGVAWFRAYNVFVWTWILAVQRLFIVHYVDLDIPSCICVLDLTLASTWWTCVVLIFCSFIDCGEVQSIKPRLSSSYGFYTKRGTFSIDVFFILIRPVRSLIGNTESIIRYLLQFLHWQP
jgi:hypothetical protein